MSHCFLGFDFGRKRIGVAIGQEVTRTAQALTTLQNQQDKPDWQAIEALLHEWKPSALVIGIPYRLDGSEQDMTQRARRFGRQLHGRFHLPVHEMDERLSSIEAEGEIRRQRKQGLMKQSSKETIDKLAAQIILQSWMNQQERQEYE